MAQKRRLLTWVEQLLHARADRVWSSALAHSRLRIEATVLKLNRGVFNIRKAVVSHAISTTTTNDYPLESAIYGCVFNRPAGDLVVQVAADRTSTHQGEHEQHKRVLRQSIVAQ